MPKSKVVCRQASDDFEAVGEAEKVFGQYPECFLDLPMCPGEMHT